jgi:hypothetical protein
MSATIDALRPDDAAEMIRIARENGQPNWHYSPGAHGTVVRDGDRVRGFCLLRETTHGFVVDELWCERTREGIASLQTLADWMEDLMARLARERGVVLKLGGIVRLDNPRHKNVLERRGYTVVAEVLAKEFQP